MSVLKYDIYTSIDDGEWRAAVGGEIYGDHFLHPRISDDPRIGKAAKKCEFEAVKGLQ